MVRRPLCILAIGLMITILCIHLISQKRLEEVDTLDSTQVRVLGTIYHKNNQKNKQVLYLKNISIQSISGKNILESNISEHMIVYLKDDLWNDNQNKNPNKNKKNNQVDLYKIGQKILLSGIMEAVEIPTNPGQFHMRNYYLGQRISHVIYQGVMEEVGESYSWYLEGLYQIRQNLKQSIIITMKDQKRAGVLSAMFLGDKEYLDDEVKNLYTQTGISHILAISGLHITMLGMGMYKLLRWSRISEKITTSICIFLMFSYGWMTGMSVSTSRALMMFTIMLMGAIVERTYDMLSALGAAAIICLLINPYSLFQVGFLLSFLAVLGIAILYPVLCDVFSVNHKVIQSLFISISVTLISLPFILYFFFQYPIYGIFLNLILLPLVGILLLSGILGSFFGLWTTKIGSILMIPCHYILILYEKLCIFVLHLPNAQVVLGRPKVWQMVLYYSILSLFLVIFRFKKRRKKKRITAMVMLLSMVIVLLYRPNSGFNMVFLDVGQGDGIYFQTPSDHHFLVDGGSSTVSKVGEYTLLPFLQSLGVISLDYVFVTHSDADHINGIAELLAISKDIKGGWQDRQGITIHHLVLPNTYDKTPYVELISLAEDKNIPVIYFSAGDHFAVGEVEVKCLHPSREWKSGEVGNMSSLVLMVSYQNLDILLTGDIEGIGEKELLMALKKQMPAK
ncbi:MAG TPA: DNA internalization-related competence protein ComEC/Rec2, partial [Candidatus Merdenecus merdavium]|nr:DNA internalization-related competence protein ComEC/Rec2 [Candidatus Merdenecus merdavium]